ncbi:MAG: hypothetical protein Fur0015_13200 [Ignavibacteriales bacterium]
MFITDKSHFAELKKIANEVDSRFSNKRLGSFIENGQTFFRLFAPNAKHVQLFLFNKVDDKKAQIFDMNSDADGVWEFVVDQNLSGRFYNYKVMHENGLNGNSPLCVDPYAKAVATYTTYFNPRKSIVFEDNYDWENDEWIQRDWRDLIIYEMHIRDLTAHKTSKAKNPGTYKGLTEKGIKGGLEYIKKLGVNTVELLPSMEFGYCEAPYMDSLYGKFNTWNPYSRNHWGYMTSNFFAPAAYYAENWKQFKWNKWIGADGKQVLEFKDMVKSFHKEGIAVLMDVVYNHLSEYEIGNLKEIDKEYYFRLDGKGNCIAQSGCGNDLKTENPMVRRLIVESILFWMKEYHIDGFRFDLGKLLDWETIEEIIHEAKKINPNVVFVCEPWGGGYDPKGFSLRGWGAWNDQIRNGVKGENPIDGLGWIFGKWYGNNNIDRLKSYVNGTTVDFRHGLFQKKEHSVNYLESHDGYTLGDFIRLGAGELKPNQKIKDVDKNAKLSANQLKLNKLAALFLFTSQGITMIHEGQEFARSKVIPINIEEPDTNKGKVDHNTYDKDNETNYLNFKHAEINKDLLDYYRGLIEIRKSFSAFRYASKDEINFFESDDNQFFFGYEVKHENQNFIVLMNSNPDKSEKFSLPSSDWEIIADANTAGVNVIKIVSGKISVEPKCGMILKKKTK